MCCVVLCVVLCCVVLCCVVLCCVVLCCVVLCECVSIFQLVPVAYCAVRNCPVESVVGAAHLPIDDAGVLRRPECVQKSPVDQKGQSLLVFFFTVCRSTDRDSIRDVVLSSTRNTMNLLTHQHKPGSHRCCSSFGAAGHLGTGPGRLCHQTSALVTRGPQPVLVYRPETTANQTPDPENTFTWKKCEIILEASVN